MKYYKLLRRRKCLWQRLHNYYLTLNLTIIFKFYTYIATCNAFGNCIFLLNFVKNKIGKTFTIFFRITGAVHIALIPLFSICTFASISVFFITLGPFSSCFRAINHDSPSFNSFDRH